MKETKFIENLSRDHKTNYSLWKATKTVKPPVESEKPLKTLCGSWARSAEEKATLFANQLSEVFKPNPPKNDFSPPVNEEILHNAAAVKVDPEDIKQIVKHLVKSKKSPGYDLITREIIKNFKFEINNQSVKF